MRIISRLVMICMLLCSVMLLGACNGKNNLIGSWDIVERENHDKHRAPLSIQFSHTTLKQTVRDYALVFGTKEEEHDVIYKVMDKQVIEYSIDKGKTWIVALLYPDGQKADINIFQYKRIY